MSGRVDTAIYNYKGALSLTPDDGALWIALAVGILVKGPLIVLYAGLAAVVLSVGK